MVTAPQQDLRYVPFVMSTIGTLLENWQQRSLRNRSSSVVQALNSGATRRVNKHVYTSFSSSINEDCPAFTCVIEKEIARGSIWLVELDMCPFGIDFDARHGALRLRILNAKSAASFLIQVRYHSNGTIPAKKLQTRRSRPR